MKKLFSIFIICLVCNTYVISQTAKQLSDAKKQEALLKSSNKVIPPITVRAAFARDFPGMAVNWIKYKRHFEATYTKDGKNMSVFYDDGGHRLESVNHITKAQLPSTISDYMNVHFAGEIITESSVVKKTNGDEYYDVEIKGGDVFFTKEGKFIKSTKD